MTKSIKKVLISFLLTLSLLLAFTAVMMAKPVQATGGVISLNQTAACRIKDELSNSGLKFTATVDKDGYRELLGAYDSVEAGIIIVPEDYVTAAGGYTLDKLSALSALEGKTYYVITETFRETETAYEFDNSIITIKPENYNRNFTGVGFIKVTEDDANLAANLDGFVEFDGAYYQYSNAHIANIYDVAFAAYEDRVTEETDGYFEAVAGSGVYGKLDSDEYGIIKNYLDGVINIVEDNGETTVKEGTYYKSPYSVVANASGDAVINENGKTATALTYKGARKTQVKGFYDGTNYVGFLRSNNATFNADGSVSVVAGNMGSFSGNTPYGSTDNGYIGFEGNYGVGTYIETTFSVSNEKVGGTETDFGHDNIPQIVLFADEINGKDYAGKGLLLSSGIDTWSGTYINGVNSNDYVGRLAVCGPNRMPSQNDRLGIVYTKEYPLFTQKGLQADKNNSLSDSADVTKTYKYIVGTKYNEQDQLVVVVTLLVKKVNGWSEIFNAQGKAYTNVELNTGLTATDVETLGTNIIIMAERKAKTAGANTTFTYCAAGNYVPEITKSAVVKLSGATIGANSNLSVAIKDAMGHGISSAGQWAAYYNYFAYEGNYGVGYYLDFTFTGYNMPGIIFFASNGGTAYASPTNYGTGTNSQGSTAQGRKGVVALNGLHSKDACFQVWGPNRMETNYGSGGQGSVMWFSYDTHPELTRKGQVENATKVYDLTIGTHIGEDETVWMEIILSSGGKQIYHIDQSLGLTEEQVGVGDIIILPQIGGYTNGDVTIDGNGSTVFDFYTTPYKK